MRLRLSGLFIALTSCLLLPHYYFDTLGFYTTKLDIESRESIHLFGFFYTAVAILIYYMPMRRYLPDKSSLIEMINTLDKRNSFHLLYIIFTVLMFMLLILFDVGAKHTESSLNFIIRLFPRELLLTISVVFLYFTGRNFWKLIVFLHIGYWILAGSKSSLFLCLLSVTFCLIIDQRRLKLKDLLYLLVIILMLPAVFVVATSIRKGVDFVDPLIALMSNATLILVLLGTILNRISWYDGLLLQSSQLEQLEQYNISDFADVIFARLLPGVATQGDPIGVLVIELFSAKKLTNFEGAIGFPGVLHYLALVNSTFMFVVFLFFIYLLITLLCRSMKSKDPIISIGGIGMLPVLLSAGYISGNFDGMFSKIIPMIVTFVIYFLLLRFFFKRTKP